MLLACSCRHRLGRSPPFHVGKGVRGLGPRRLYLTLTLGYDGRMTQANTIFHIYERDPEAVERALTEVFAREERPVVLRLQGTFSGVLAKAIDLDLAANYRYLICRPHPDSEWAPVLELGTRTEGLGVELSQRLDGAAVFTVFVYGDAVSGYRLARGGVEVDRYISDPTYFTVDEEAAPQDFEAERGHPERFADLLPGDTDPEDFVRVVLRPGWWEDFEATTGYAPAASAEAEEDDAEEGEGLVDEVDRMRCIALALELWGAEEYPFSQDLEDIPNKAVGPGIILAFE